MECVRAYNDWLHDWTSVAPERYIKIAAIPYWDIDAAIEESHRVFNLGFKGVLFTRSPDAGTTAGSVTLPNIADPHWEPLFHTWEDLGFPVQFHGGGGGAPATLGPRFHLGYRPNGLRANYAKNISGVGRRLTALCGADRQRHLPPLPETELRGRGERDRLDPLLLREHGLAVDQLRRGAWSIRSTT